MPRTSTTGLLSALAAAVAIAALALSATAQARSGDWADRQKAKKARLEQARSEASQKPQGSGQ